MKRRVPANPKKKVGANVLNDRALGDMKYKLSMLTMENGKRVRAKGQETGNSKS